MYPLFDFERVRFLTKEGFDVGDITWVCPKAFGASSSLKWLACIVKKMENVFDPPGTFLESEHDQEISSSIKSLL